MSCIAFGDGDSARGASIAPGYMGGGFGDIALRIAGGMDCLRDKVKKRQSVSEVRLQVSGRNVKDMV